MNSKNLVFSAAVSLCLGALLPWVTAGRFLSIETVSGLETDGILTAGAGLVILLIGLAAKAGFSRGAGIAILSLASIALLILVRLYSALTETLRLLSDNFGAGMHLSLLGAVIGIVAGLSVIRETKETK